MLFRTSILVVVSIEYDSVVSVIFAATLALVSGIDEACGIVVRKITENTSFKGITLAIVINNVSTVCCKVSIDNG